MKSVGQGAHGTVYKARDPELDRAVAIKVPRSGNLGGTEQLSRFVREARSVAQLRHPAIVPVHEVGEWQPVGSDDKLIYLASEFVEGITLADLLTSRRPTFREAADLIAQLAEALDYAHQMGVVHRDVKPSNVMLERSTAESAEKRRESSQRSSALSASSAVNLRPRLMDFGLAKRDAGEITMTVDGQVLGTPAYMSPEQARGEAHKVDGRSDVYSLGVILYELLTGDLPFRGNTRMLLHQVLHEEPRSPRSLNDKISRDLETICLKAMAKDTGKRYQSGRALADDLRRWLNGDLIVARPAGPVEKTIKWMRKHPTAAAVMGLCFAMAIGLVAAGFWYQAQLQATREQARATELVKSLATTDTVFVPRILEDLAPYRGKVRPLLEELLAESEPESPARLHAALALLPSDPSHLAYLRDRALAANPRELLVVRQALVPHKDDLADELWTLAEDGAAPEDRRFRSACLLAGFAAEDERWNKLAADTARRLVAESPLLVGEWTELLRPARPHLLTPLSELAMTQPPEAGTGGDPETRLTVFQQRSLAISILADYAADQPRALANLLVNVGSKPFAVFYPKLAAHPEAARELLEGILAEKVAPFARDAEYDQLAQRQANAAIALAKLGHADNLWPLLKHSPDPSLRSYLIDRCASHGVPLDLLAARLLEEPDVTVRRALILALGEYGTSEPRTSVSGSRRDADLAAKLIDWYRTDPDPGIHAACAWTLRQWGQRDKLPAIDKELAAHRSHAERGNERRWFVNSQGQTFTVIPGPVVILMGSPESEPDRAAEEV